jgi:hypothetical protein
MRKNLCLKVGSLLLVARKLLDNFHGAARKCTMRLQAPSMNDTVTPSPVNEAHLRLVLTDVTEEAHFCEDQTLR